FFFSSRRRHTRSKRDWSSDVCSSDLGVSKKDMYLALVFLVACHAVVEDTLIFIPLGIPVWPLLLIRLITAILLTMTIAFIWKRTDKRKKKKKEIDRKRTRQNTNHVSNSFVVFLYV